MKHNFTIPQSYYRMLSHIIFVTFRTISWTPLFNLVNYRLDNFLHIPTNILLASYFLSLATGDVEQALSISGSIKRV